MSYRLLTGPTLKSATWKVSGRVAGRSAALGFDGKWVLHPGQIEAANETFGPSQADYDHAENILDAYDWFTSDEGGQRGAVMLGEEMIDEASRKMALVVSAEGQLQRHEPYRNLGGAHRTVRLSTERNQHAVWTLSRGVQSWSRLQALAWQDGYRDGWAPLCLANDEPPSATSRLALFHRDRRLWPKCRGWKLHLFAALGHVKVADISGKAIANLEIESLRHVKPTFHGDTIYGETEVLEITPSRSKTDRGIVYVKPRIQTGRPNRVHLPPESIGADHRLWRCAWRGAAGQARAARVS